MIKANFSLHWLLVPESHSANSTGSEETYWVFVLSCVQIGVSLAKMTWIVDQLRTRALIYRKRGGGKADVQRRERMWRNALERFAEVCSFPEDRKVFKRSSLLPLVLVKSELAQELMSRKRWTHLDRRRLIQKIKTEEKMAYSLLPLFLFIVFISCVISIFERALTVLREENCI